jgi:hypothetical protein
VKIRLAGCVVPLVDTVRFTKDPVGSLRVIYNTPVARQRKAFRHNALRPSNMLGLMNY